MKFQWKKTIALSAAAFGLVKMSMAQKAINVVQTSVPFLTISPDARSGAMGNTGIATSPDAFSTFWNNAKVPFSSSNGQIGFTYTPWLSDITSDVYLLSLGGYYKLDDNSALTGGVRYFNLGSIPLTGETGEMQGTSNPKEFAIEAGYSRKVSDKFGVGLTARYINSNLGSGTQSDGTSLKTANALAFDLSGYYNGLDDAGQGFTAGLTISNLGTKIAYSSDPDAKVPLPANIGLGGAYHAVIDEDNKLTFSGQVDHLLVPKLDTSAQGYADYYSTGVASGWGKSFSNSAYAFSVGAEYGYDNMFFLRAGYHAETQNQGDLHYLTAGVGIKYNVLDFNFAYLAPSGSGFNRNPLSNTLRFSLAFDLGSQNK